MIGRDVLIGIVGRADARHGRVMRVDMFPGRHRRTTGSTIQRPAAPARLAAAPVLPLRDGVPSGIMAIGLS